MHLTICAVVVLFLYSAMSQQNVRFSQTRRLGAQNYGDAYHLHHYKQPSQERTRPLFSWDTSDVNRIVSAQYKMSAATLNVERNEKMNQNKQKERNNIWWPWANYKEWFSVHRKEEITTISGNSKQSKSISKATHRRKPKIKHSQRLKNKNRRTNKTKGKKKQLIIKPDKQFLALNDSSNCEHSDKQKKDCQSVFSESIIDTKEGQHLNKLDAEKKSEKSNINKSENLETVSNSTTLYEQRQDHVLPADVQVSHNLEPLGETEANVNTSKNNFTDNNYTESMRKHRSQSEEYDANVTTESTVHTEPNIIKYSDTRFGVSTNLGYSRNPVRFNNMETKTNRLPFTRTRNTKKTKSNLNGISTRNMPDTNKDGSESVLSRSLLQKWKTYLLKLAKRNYTSDENGGCQGLCINMPGSYSCHCPLGFRLDSNRKKCQDVNECVARNGHGPCQGNCINTWGSYRCLCDSLPGTILADDKHSCHDIDECSSSVYSSGCSHLCINTIGTVFCLCPDGYTLGEDWKTCQDVDECTAAELHDMTCKYGCVNTLGSYYCL